MKEHEAPRKKDYPKTVQIRGNTWKVKWVSPSDERPWCGLCDPSTKTISLEMGRGRVAQCETFCHELVHAFAFELNIPKLHHHGWIKKIEKEIPMFLLANGMLPLFKSA